nr:hypothetical protein [Candidatus Njordarchaeota archaeon]
MEDQRDAICLRNGVILEGLEDLVLSAIVGFPSREVYAEILRNENRYLFHPLDEPPSFSQPSQPSMGTSHVGYLFSKRLRNASDYDFDKRLQPSISDLRSMYESGDTLRSFIVTNGVGWAFRLFDFHNVSLAELNWLEFGFIKAMRNAETVDAFFNCIPKRMALGLLQGNRGIIEFLVGELEAVVTGIERLQDYNGVMIPTGRINELLAVAPGVLVVGEAFQKKDELQPSEVFEQHMVGAFNAIKGGDNKLALSEALKFSLPAISILTEVENGPDKLGRITDMNSHLLQLRLPDVPESKKLKILVDFLKKTLEYGYRFLKEGYYKRKMYREQGNRSSKKADGCDVPCSQSQIGGVGGLTFNDIGKFMFEATSSYPNRVIGQIVHPRNQANRYAITDVKLVPCDMAISISSRNTTRKDSFERRDIDSSTVLVGKSVSKVCCCEHEMFTLLHPSTYTLNEMLRSGFTFNAIAVTNGERCLLRLHDGSNNSILTASLPHRQRVGETFPYKGSVSSC